MNFGPGGIPSGPNLPPTICKTEVEFRISCRNLLDRDIASKSDPMVVLYMDIGNRWVEKGRTENIRNCLNPDFQKALTADYYFEEVQKVKFSVFDIDNSTPQLDDDDFLGSTECTLGQIVSTSPFTKPLMAPSGHKMGNSTITIHAEEVNTENKDLLVLSFQAKKLDKKDFFGKSDPFLEFRRPDAGGNWVLVHRTEVVKRNLNPVWKTFEIKTQTLGGGNHEASILISCFNHNRSGSHDYIGECTITLAQLTEAQTQPTQWPCINKKMREKKGKSYKDSGTIILISCKVTKLYSFLDYVFGGTQINFTVAIDFTASNGDPHQPNSLHYFNPGVPNEYMKAILSVGNVIQDYDSDKMFPALGFGARLPPDWQVSHEFALNFNMANPFCSGVQGLLDAYCQCLPQVQLYGPTNFSPVIKHVARFAQQAHQEPTPSNYFILLIITDGVVTDMDNTRREIVAASHLPMSVIIVGVGRADFTAMDFLDGDGSLLRSPEGTAALRDIVQFVPFYKYERAPPALLAKEVLAEIPQQLTQYYKMRDLPPNPPRQNVHDFT